MAGSAFKDAKTVEVLAGFTPILVADTDPAYDEAARKYGISGYPTVVFARKDGSEIGRSIGVPSVAQFRATALRALAAPR